MVEKTTSNNPELKEDQGADSPKYVTSEQLNAAITAKFRSFEAKQQETLSRIEQLLSPKKEEQQEEKPKKEDASVLSLKQQVERLTQDKKRSRENALKSRLQEELLAAGVNKQALKALVALHMAENAVEYESEDSDEIVYKTQDSVYQLKDGISAWAKTEDAKAFLAARGVTGSNDRSYATPKEIQKAPSTEEFMNNFFGRK